MKNLTKAKAQLILDQPFFASILLSMPMIEDSSVPTIATNGEQIVYNREFMEKLTLSETVFALAHETMHCVFQHMHRRGTRNANRYNIAADYVINDLLVNDRIGKPINGALINPALVKQGNGTTEGVYVLLPEETEKQAPGTPESGGSMDDCQDASTDPAENAAKESEMRVKIVQAANAAKMMGKLSAGLQRIVGEMTKTRTDWKAILRRFLSERAKVDLSYAKPKRRFMADDICLPSLTGEKLGGIVVAIDCSGSIDERLLDIFAAEIRGIIQDVCPVVTHVLYFDSEVSSHESFAPENDFKLNPTGGGGTAFSPIFKYIEANDFQPTACVVLTDLCCNDFGAAPEYPVLWATIELENAPWGEVVKIRE